MILQFNIEDKYGCCVENITPQEIVEFAKKNNFKYLIIFARDGWGRAFYDSNIYPKHPKIKENFIKQISELAQEKNIKLVLMVCHTSNKYLAEKYPDAIQRNHKGEIIYLDSVIIDDIEWPLACLNSKFKEICLQEISEVLSFTNYIMLDSFRYQPDLDKQCFCENCKREYQKRFNDNLEYLETANEKFFRQWFWRYEVIIDRLQEIKSKYNVKLIYNSHPAGWRWRNNYIVEYGREYIDIVFAEASEVDFQPLGFLAEITLLSKGLSKREVWTSRNIFHYINTPYFVGLHSLELYSFEILYSGGIPLFTMFLSTYILNKNKIDLSNLNNKLEQVKQELEKYKPIKEVAIVFSNSTLNYLGYKNPRPFIEEMRGFFYSLYYNNYQISFVGERDLHELSQYKAVILPNVASMKEKDANVIKKLENTVIATYMTSLYDKYEKRNDFLLSEEFGAKYKEIIKSAFYIEDIVYPQHIGNVVKVQPTSEIKKILLSAKYKAGYEYVLGLSPPPRGTNVLSYITKNKFVYFPFELGRYIFRYNYPEYVKLFLEELKIEKFVLETPAGVRVFVYEGKNGKYALGILNYNVNQRISTQNVTTSFLKDNSFSISPIKYINTLTNVLIKLNKEFSEAESLFSSVYIRNNKESSELVIKELKCCDFIILQ